MPIAATDGRAGYNAANTREFGGRGGNRTGPPEKGGHHRSQDSNRVGQEFGRAERASSPAPFPISGGRGALRREARSKISGSNPIALASQPEKGIAIPPPRRWRNHSTSRYRPLSRHSRSGKTLLSFGDDGENPLAQLLLQDMRTHTWFAHGSRNTNDVESISVVQRCLGG